MAKSYSTEGVTFQVMSPQEFINQMIASGIANTREEAIAKAIFNGKPVLAARNWARACYQGGTVSEGTSIKLALIFQSYNHLAA
jgi:hypothetical protein